VVRIEYMRLSYGVVVSFSVVMFVAGGAFPREFGEATFGDLPARARLLAECFHQDLIPKFLSTYLPESPQS
jgi:hypothetical protein